MRIPMLESELLLSGQGLTLVRCFSEVASTMDEARLLGAELGPQGFGLVLALQQSKGRGRQGRAWTSAAEGFWGTFLLPLAGPLTAVTGFSLAVGCVLRRVCVAEGVQVKLKWPNDALSVDGAKLAGVLIELVSEPAGHLVLCGIGLNLSGEPQIEVPTTSLSTLAGRHFDLMAVAKAISRELASAWAVFCRDGLAAFRDEWLAAAYGRGSQVVADIGKTQLSGTLDGISANGCLLIRNEQGTHEVAAGHVRIVEPGV